MCTCMSVCVFVCVACICGHMHVQGGLSVCVNVEVIGLFQVFSSIILHIISVFFNNFVINDNMNDDGDVDLRHSLSVNLGLTVLIRKLPEPFWCLPYPCWGSRLT